MINYTQLNYLIERDGLLTIPDPRETHMTGEQWNEWFAWRASLDNAGYMNTFGGFVADDVVLIFYVRPMTTSERQYHDNNTPGDQA